MDQIQSKTLRILKVISDSQGMRFSDIQRALWYMSNSTPFTRELRGYWCTNLLGGDFYHGGILKVFCTKGSDGLWHEFESPIIIPNNIITEVLCFRHSKNLT